MICSLSPEWLSAGGLIIMMPTTLTYVHFFHLLDHETTLIRHKEKDLDLVIDKLRRPRLCLKDVFNRFIYSIWWRYTV
jgi:hypothetical protein